MDDEKPLPCLQIPPDHPLAAPLFDAIQRQRELINVMTEAPGWLASAIPTYSPR